MHDECTGKRSDNKTRVQHCVRRRHRRPHRQHRRRRQFSHDVFTGQRSDNKSRVRHVHDVDTVDTDTVAGTVADTVADTVAVDAACVTNAPVPAPLPSVTHTPPARAPAPPHQNGFRPLPPHPLQCKLRCKLHCNQNCPHQPVSQSIWHLPPDCVRRNHCNLWCRRDARTVRARGRRPPRPRRQKLFLCDIIRGPSSADVTHTPCARRTCTPPATPPRHPRVHTVCA